MRYFTTEIESFCLLHSLLLLSSTELSQWKRERLSDRGWKRERERERERERLSDRGWEVEKWEKIRELNAKCFDGNSGRNAGEIQKCKGVWYTNTHIHTQTHKCTHSHSHSHSLITTRYTCTNKLVHTQIIWVDVLRLLNYWYGLTELFFLT